MIRKIRRKFIIIAMTVIFFVMAGVLGIVNLVNVYNAFNDAKTRLTIISANRGEIPFDWVEKKNNITVAEFNKVVTPETRFVTRFFTAVVDSEGVVKSINLNHVASIKEENAIKFASAVMDSTAKVGFRTGEKATYMYMITPLENEKNLVVFLDVTTTFETCRAVASLSATVGFLAYILIAIIVGAWSKKAIEPMIESNERQKQFITNAGHELKTPLAIISANTEVIELTNGSDEWTQSTLAQVKRLTTLVNSLVTLTRMDEGQGEIKLGNFNISKLAGDAVNSFRSIITTENKSLQVEIEPDINYNTNKDVFSELVNILMDNAVKYCDDGGTITACLSRKGKNVKLSVSNDYKEGCSEDCPKFFERFYRNDT